MKMQSNNHFLLIKLLTLHYLLVLSASQDFDFFYLVQQWPGSYCDTNSSCCYPTTGKPKAEFGIHGLWPNWNNGSYPSDCDSSNPFDASEISDLMSQMESEWPTLSCPSNDGLKFWGHEWNKHGTCSESVLDQHEYFSTTLNLKTEINLLGALEDAGIHPNGSEYSLTSIRDAIKVASGYTPYIECNKDSSGNSQLYQIYLCVDSLGSCFIECPFVPGERCGASTKFPSF
ncbi:ribonuclease 1-like [Bidens hawaiensis]|uniref:ribonuclease 1-like n=1 Tax=Bidens hawaiensis TaxID=980011 RepID=UPI0040494358